MNQSEIDLTCCQFCNYSLIPKDYDSSKILKYVFCIKFEVLNKKDDCCIYDYIPKLKQFILDNQKAWNKYFLDKSKKEKKIIKEQIKLKLELEKNKKIEIVNRTQLKLF